MIKLTQKILKELLHYDPETGTFIWRERDVKYFSHCKNPEHRCNVWNARFSNTFAENKSKHKNSIAYYVYIGITLDKKSKNYKAHRLAFLYMTGEFIEKHVDHIDGNSMNNSWTNLREVTNQENQKNCKLSSNNLSGYNGVCFAKRERKWLVSIGVNKRKIFGGYFTNKEDAIKRRKELNLEYGFHENHGRKR